VNPYHDGKHLRWRTDDWDPALQFWDLPYDPHLVQWQTAADPGRPSTMAALEFGGQAARWRRDAAGLLAVNWLDADDLAWQPDQIGFNRVRAEIEELQQLMQDDRQRYLPEAEQQADGVDDYFIHFLGASQGRHPWTIELIACGLAIGNVAYMYYKGYFRRVRPSLLCPGLVPPFGPPAHPSFPSGHSFLGHLIALLLLEIPGLAHRYGLFEAGDGSPGIMPDQDTLDGRGEVESPLLWLAQRLAKNRERIGVHYISDSTAGRHLAAAIWWAMLHEPDADRISCPTLEWVIQRAIPEWYTPW